MIFRAGLQPADLLERRAMHLWSLHTDAARCTDEVVGRFSALLSAEEQARAARFRLEHLQRSFVVTRGALRVILGAYLRTTAASLQFVYGANGKPSIRSPEGIEFNTSHSAEMAVFAVARGTALGVDIERMRTLKHMREIAERFFCKAEAEELESLPVDERVRAFFLCWTRKEAYIKATGQGLSAALDSFRVSLRPGAPPRCVHIEGSAALASEWSLHHLEVAPEYAAALAYKDAQRPIAVLPPLDPKALLEAALLPRPALSMPRS